VRPFSSFWDIAYLTGFTPWDSDEPAEELVELVERSVIKPCRALDIGCGTGTNVIFLASKGFEAHGLDISKVALSKAIKKASSKGVKCYFHHLDIRDTIKVSELGKFDLILDVGCYHSLPQGKDRIMYISSLNNILKKGGEYLIWCFIKGKNFSFGPPGVDEDEIEKKFGERYAILEKRRINSSFRDMLFYYMRRLN